MSKTSKTIVETEWSYFWDSSEYQGGKEKLSLSPSEDEAKRLAQRLDLLALDALKAEIEISRAQGEVAFNVRGVLSAEVTQKCVVSLEPVKSHIEDEFEAWYADPDAAISIAKARHEKLNEKGHGELPILEEHDDPEPLIDGKIDLGELVTQYLSLSLNPYPHAEGVAFEVSDENKKQSEEVKNPFAALKDWKDRMNKGEEP